MGMMGVDNSNRQTITFKNADGTVAGTMSITKSKKKKTKRLQYNFKEISAQVMRAKTPVSARQAAAKARHRAAMLRRQLKCGEYDDKELEYAIMHAEQMERVAKKRMKHLKEEESVKRESTARQTEPHEKKETVSLTDMEFIELELLKKKHRSNEIGEIMEADTKYLKALFHKLQKEKQEALSGASLELGGIEIPPSVTEAPVVTEGGSVDVLT